MKLQKTLGLIGAGNMGGAILEGLLDKKIAEPAQIWSYDKIPGKVAALQKQWKIHQAASNSALVKEAQLVLLAVKPQDLAVTMEEIKAVLTPSHVLISILAGTSLDRIRELAAIKLEIVRAMPNLGARVGAALTALTGTSEKGVAFAEIIFSGCGRTLRLEEKYFDMITALSGSGPAYFFYLMELLADEGRSRGLSAEQARLVAVQTALGAALLASSSEEAPALLREKVTSRGGTTEAALKKLMPSLPAVFKDAIQAACDRGRELSQDKI